MARKKTGDQRRRERLRHYRREYARLKTRLREIGFICEGTLVERWMQCGKPNCACATDRASQQGPYYQLSWKEKGKTESRRLPAEHATLYRQWIANRQRLQSIIQQMHGPNSTSILPTTILKQSFVDGAQYLLLFLSQGDHTSESKAALGIA